MAASPSNPWELFYLNCVLLNMSFQFYCANPSTNAEDCLIEAFNFYHIVWPIVTSE